MRAPGLPWHRLPLFIWSLYSTSVILVLATPVLAITLALMALERIWGLGLFDPKLGGDPVLFQHLFWFYSHPAVYIMILPGMGVISETDYLFLAEKNLWLLLRRLFERRHRRSRISGLGTSHVRYQPIGLCGVHFLPPQLSGGGAVGRESVQLDRNAASRLDLASDAHALRARVYRSLSSSVD